MPEPDDQQLLREFAETGSEAAFAALVARHVDLVHATALRFGGNPHRAEEITQAVFIILARKAGSLGGKVVLSGWLYQTARLTAANVVKSEIRRQRREQEAYMQATLDGPDPAVWEQVAPLLEDAMGQLGEADRNAVVLRFFENKTAREAAAALQMTEAAAHKRMNRALERLRKIFAKRGVALSGAIIAGAVSANAVQAAPVGLAKTISVVAISKGSTATASTMTLVKGTMKMMTWLKFKFATIASAVVLLAGGAATVAVSQTQSPPQGDKLTTAEIFQKAKEAYGSLSSYSDEGKSVSALNGMALTTTFKIKLERPDLYRVEWEQPVHSSYTNKGAVWCAGAGDFMVMGDGEPQNQGSKESALGGATGVSGGAAATVPGTFFKMNWGNQLGGPAAKQERLADDKVGDVDCYVFSSELKGTVKTLWIGKKDFLIHQVRTVTSPEALKAALDQAAKVTGVRPQNGSQGGVVSTETHFNIVVNQKLSPEDFRR